MRLIKRFSLFMAALGLPLTAASAQSATPNSASFTSFNETSINQVLDGVNLKADRKQDPSGQTYFEIKIESIIVIIQPVDCKKDAPDQCPVARFNAIIDLPAAGGPDAAKRQKYIAKMHEFNGVNAFLKVYQTGDRMIAVRYVNASFGVKVGTIRTELQLFSNSLRQLFNDYLQKT